MLVFFFSCCLTAAGMEPRCIFTAIGIQKQSLSRVTKLPDCGSWTQNNGQHWLNQTLTLLDAIPPYQARLFVGSIVLLVMLM